jgi:sec-independent protein translocase protein TatA
MPGFVGLPEIILLGLVVLLVFGPKRLPEMGRSLGRGMREFKDSVTNDSPKSDVEETQLDLTAASETPVVVVPERIADRTAA